MKTTDQINTEYVKIYKKLNNGNNPGMFVYYNISDKEKLRGIKQMKQELKEKRGKL